MIIVTEENYVELFQTKPYKPTIGVDLDGTLNTYDGLWLGYERKYDKLPDASDLLKGIKKRKYRICIMTARRDLTSAYDWLCDSLLGEFVDLLTNFKVPCFAYIDDRNLCYNGDAYKTLAELDTFLPWWRTTEDSLDKQDRI